MSLALSVADSIAVLLAPCSDAYDSTIPPFIVPDTYVGIKNSNNACGDGIYFILDLEFFDLSLILLANFCASSCSLRLISCLSFRISSLMYILGSDRKSVV